MCLIAIVSAGGIYALFFREPGGRLAPHDAHAVRIFANLYFTPIAFGLALTGYASGGVAIVLARARADSDDHGAVGVLLLQDEDLARALLARAPVPDGDSARVAPLRVRRDLRAGLDEATSPTSWRPSRSVFTAIGMVGHLAPWLSLSVRVAADSRTCRVRGRDPAARATRVEVQRQRSRAGRGARRVGSACARAAPVIYLRAQRARPVRLAPRQACGSRVPHVGARTLRERVFHRGRRHRSAVAWRRFHRCCDGAISGAGVRKDRLRRCTRGRRS